MRLSFSFSSSSSLNFHLLSFFLFSFSFSLYIFRFPTFSFRHVWKAYQQSKRVVTSRVQSVYFVSELSVGRNLPNLLKNFYTTPLQFCSSAFLSVVRLPIPRTRLNKSVMYVYLIRVNCSVSFEKKFLFSRVCKYENTNTRKIYHDLGMTNSRRTS